MLTLKVRYQHGDELKPPRIDIMYGLETQRVELDFSTGAGPFEDTVIFNEPKPVLAAPPDRRARKLSQKQERQIASDVGGRVQPASGARPGSKGDVRAVGRYRIEAKTTRARSYRLELSDLRKIASECGLGEKSAFIIRFLTPDGRNDGEFAVVPYNDWLETTREPPGNDR